MIAGVKIPDMNRLAPENVEKLKNLLKELDNVV